jgi:hypothetical protein
MIQERFSIGIVVRIYRSLVSDSFQIQALYKPISHDIQDCFTHKSFFQAPFRLRRGPAAPNFLPSLRVKFAPSDPRGGRNVATPDTSPFKERKLSS